MSNTVKLAIIGGTGLTSLNNLNSIRSEIIQTPYGEPSGALNYGEILGNEVVFIARHGSEHTIPPHKVNYCANIWALHQAGITHIIAINAVGGITAEFKPATISIPDQIIDYTYSRKHTFFEDELSDVVHIDFTEPYCSSLRNYILSKSKEKNIEVVTYGTYAATQGPRLESVAEIKRLEKDGCDLVGMTGMPEAALARELEMCYASVAVVANFAAGKSQENITMEIIHKNLTEGMARVKNLLDVVISDMSSEITV